MRRCCGSVGGSRSEVDKPALHVHAHQLRLYLVAHFHSLLATDELALDGKVEQADEDTEFRHTSHRDIEAFIHATGHEESAGRFARLPFEFRDHFFLIRAMLRKLGQFRGGIRDPLSGDRRLQEAMRDEIDVAPIRRRGVGIVSHRQSKVAFAVLPRNLDRILAAADQLHDRQRKILKRFRRGGATAIQEALQRLSAGLCRKRFSTFRRQHTNALPTLR